MPDLFDQIQYQPPQQVAAAPQPQGDLFDQIEYQPPQQTQAQYQQTLMPMPQQAPAVVAPLPAPQPGQPLQAGVQENWFQALPVVKDFQRMQKAGDWGGGLGSFFQGMPAGPMEMVDMGSSVERWLQDQTANAIMNFRLPQGLAPMQRDMIQQGVMQALEGSPVRMPQTNFARDYQAMMAPKYPGIFGGGAFAGQALVPAGTAGKGASLAQKLKVGAAGGAAMSGLFDVGTQYRDTGAVNPAQTAASVALGGAIGAGGSGLIHGIEKGMGALARRFNLLPQAPQQTPRFNQAQIGQGLDAQAQAELAALAQQAAPQEVAPVIQGLRNLAQEGDLSNYFKGDIQQPPMPRAQTPEEALAALAQMTARGQKGTKGATAPRSQAAPKAEPDPIDVAKARMDLIETVRAAASQDELDSIAEQATRWVQKNFTNGEVRKAFHQEISRQRKARMADFETGDKPKLDATIEKMQAPESPEDAANSLKEWAKDALGEELDPATLGAPKENVPPFYVLDDKIALDAREKQQFPLAFEEYLFPNKKVLRTAAGEDNGFRPYLLDDADLQTLVDMYDVEARMTTHSAHAKAKINQAVKGLAQEVHRREQRKALGVPLKMGSEVREIRQLEMDELLQVIDNGTEKQQLQAIAELARRENPVNPMARKEPGANAAPAKPNREMGDFRRTIDDNMKGRNKNRLAVDVHENEMFNKRPIKLMLHKFGDAKVQKDYTEARLKDFVSRFRQQFVPEGAEDFELPGGGRLKAVIDESPSIATEKALDAARERLATGVGEAKRPVIAGMLSKYFGEGPDKIPFTKADMPEDVETAAKVLRKLYAEAKEAERAYAELKPTSARDALETAERSLETKRNAKGLAKDIEAVQSAKTEKAREAAQARVDEKQAAIAELEAKVKRLQGKVQQADADEKLIQSLERDFAKQVGDETAPINLKTRIPHPEEGVTEPIEFALEYKKGQKEMYVPAENADEWARVKEEILRQDSNRPRKKFWQMDGNSMRKALPATGTGAAVANFFSGSAAHAADLGGKAVQSGGVDILAAWNSMPLTEVAAGALMLHKIAPKVAKALLNEDSFAGASLWKNTLDHVDYLERIKAVDAGFKKRILNHTAQTLKASWGISFDEDAKALGMHYLREGHVTAQEVVAGASKRTGQLATQEHQEAMKHFAQMDPAQKSALAAYKIAQDSLKREITKQLAAAIKWRAKNVPAGTKGARVANIDESIQALKWMLEQVSPRGKAFNLVDRTLSKMRSNFMDYAFFWNLKYHGTNLVTDPFIAGGSMTGPMNILRAWKLLATDKELKQLYKNSNLVGGYRAERVQEGVIQKSGEGFRLFPKTDIPSDAISADRVSLSALLQYQQRNKDALLKAGFSGSDVDFAKAVLKGDQSIPADMAADAFIHMTGTLSEALGVDTFRINTDIASRSMAGSQMGVFFKQPARISRLAMRYLAEGNFKSFYTLLGYTAVVGGATASIPLELQIAGQVINPESYFKAAAAADQADLYFKATGKRLGPKATWSLLWALQAVNNPVLQGPQEALGGMISASMEGKPDKFLKAALKALPMVKAKVAGIPVRQVQEGFRTWDEIQKGQMKSFFVSDPILKKPDFKKTITIPFERIQRSPVTHWLQQFIPGIEPSKYQHQKFVEEQRARKGRGQMVPPDQQYNSPADIYADRSPMDMFFGGVGR